ncbi:MAG: transglycosylase SLT domain-containing protein [Myxococcota bacterium]
MAFVRAVLDREAARKLDAGERERVARELVFAEHQYDLPVTLALAIIKQESRFDPAARGPSGSIGLMQLQPATAREIAERTGLVWTSQSVLRNPEVNVRLGIAYLVELRNRFKNTEHAVGAYNIGPAKMRRLLARRPFRRGPYLTKVYGHAEALENEYLD